jgi:hypothetical protein
MKIQSFLVLALTGFLEGKGTKFDIVDYVTADVSKRCPSQCSILRTNSCKKLVTSMLEPKCEKVWHRNCIHRRSTCSTITKQFMLLDQQVTLNEALNSTSTLCPFECSSLKDSKCESFVTSEVQSWKLSNRIPVGDDFLKCSKAWKNSCEQKKCGEIIKNEIGNKIGSFKHDFSIILPQKYFKNQTSEFFLKLKTTEAIATVNYRRSMMALKDYKTFHNSYQPSPNPHIDRKT